MYTSLPETPSDSLLQTRSDDHQDDSATSAEVNSTTGAEYARMDQPPEIPSEYRSKKKNCLASFFAGYCHHGWWTIPMTLLLIVAVLLIVPVSRYPILAFGLKQSYTVRLMDSRTNTPVSGARVFLDGSTETTSNTGNATFHARVGARILTVYMKYYKHATQAVFVGISSTHNNVVVQMNATGRQVPIMVVNKITGKSIADADVKILDTNAKTDQHGMATIVLPTSAPTQSAVITAAGYNQMTANVEISDTAVLANTFAVTPVGRIYFLSNLSGMIDVVSTNLDGTNRQTVLAGTGMEDATSTTLLAAHDWKYLALLSKRDGGQHAKLFLIDTSTSQMQMTPMDATVADFTPIGWSGHYFLYEATLVNANSWQSGKTLLQSYNADTGKIVSIDQTTALGSAATYMYNYFGFADIVNTRVVYGFGWTDFNSDYLPNNLGGQKIMLMSANLDGSGKQDLRDIPISNGITYAYATALQYTPQILYIQTALGSQSSVYYTYQDQNNTVTQSNTITSDSFSAAQQNHIPYLISPSGSATFWDEQRDGKNTLFTGDSNGENGTQIAAQSDYAPYAWFTDTYVLVRQNNNELYIMPASGGVPMKISDYYHPNAVPYTSSGIGSYGSL